MAERLGERARAACEPFGVRVESCHVSCHATLQALPDVAEALDADLVVVGADVLRRPAGLASLGRLLHGLSCPLLVARPGSWPGCRAGERPGRR